MLLFDNHNRPLTYLRLAVTDRCNLRCFYCMPAEGVPYLPQAALLTDEEIIRLVRLMAGMGIHKVRLTGGEPFVRPGLMDLIRALIAEAGIRDVHLTTNGVLTAPHVPELSRLGVRSVNLSLDTLDPQRFLSITRRDNFAATRETLNLLLYHGVPVKINAVVMDGKNIDDIVPLAELARQHPVAVRFIEEMPFNGEGAHYAQLPWPHTRIVDHLRQHYPDLRKIDDPDHATASGYHVPGFAGTLGVIAAFTRNFCGSCNRIRVTAQGMLKTCLYDDGVLDIKALLRSGAHDEELRNALLQAFGQRAKDGHEAEQHRRNKRPVQESMSTIGG